MKRLIAIVLIGVLGFVFTSCGTNVSFEGEWKAVSIDTAGHKISSEEQKMIETLLADYNISVKSDGTAVFTRGDKEGVMNASWTARGNNITFKTSAEGEVKGKMEDELLVINMNSKGKLIFDKR